MNIKAIRDERIDHDLTQQDVADKLQISRQYYSRYESGQVEMPLRHLITLAQLYNCSLDYLAGLAPKEPDSASPNIMSAKNAKKIVLANTLLAAVKKFNENEGEEK